MPAGVPPVPLKRSKKKVEKMKEFSELVREQYGFLVGQLEKVLQDYFGLSARVKEMHTEIFSLKAELAKALTYRCMRENYDRRLAVDDTAAI